MRKLFVVATVFACGLVPATAASAATTTATVSPTSGPPATSVTVTGTGFDPDTAIDVFFGTTDLALTTSNASGAVSTTVTVPASAQPGGNWITLDEESTHAAAQALYTVQVNWAQAAFGPSWRGFNPYEDTIGVNNVSQVAETWSQPVSNDGNPKPFVDYSGHLYVYDESGELHAYTEAGKLIWTAAPGTFEFEQAAPTSANGLVYVGTAGGVVDAYKYLCRTDGGVCTPQWSKNIGTEVEGGLTVRNGLLYAPGADGTIHVLNATSGAAGTNITPAFGSGALSSAVAFSDDGSAYVAQGSDIDAITPSGQYEQSFGSGTYLSQPAVGNATAYFTSSLGYLYDLNDGWDVALGGTTGCSTAPVYANSVVYAAGCTTLGAYQANTGAELWSISTAGQSAGLAYANGVLYACIADRLEAYDAAYGGLLWGGGYCSIAPEIINAAVFVASNELSASTLTGAYTTSMLHRRPPRPNPRRLRPSARLLRRYDRRHHRGHDRHRGARSRRHG